MKQGIHRDITNADYHAETGVNASFLKQWITKSPFHAMHNKFNLAKTVADVGTAVHSEALEPELGNVLVSDEKSRATKAFKELDALAQAQGKVVLPRKDYDMVKGMVHGVEADYGEVVGGLLNDKHCGKLLQQKDKQVEHSYFVEHPGTGLLLKCRPDIYSPNLRVMGDVKSAAQADPRNFGKAIFRLGYHFQAAHYLLCAKLLEVEVQYFGFLAVEKEWPYPAHFHTLDMAALEYATNVVETALQEIAEAKETGKYDTRWGSFSMHNLPDYLDQ